MIELPGYTIEKQLGRGGMARVYLARHIGLDRLVAIKVLSKDLDGDKSFSDRFMREARIVANLTHQHIITVHDVGVYNEFHYIAMEYLPEDTLDEKIKKKLDVKLILSIIKQIASALDFAHKKGIVHRDVKPDNILFREDGTAVLTDFGIARSTKSETKMTATGTVIGTPHYMSPEQAQGQEVGSWSDLYSLGIVLFEMLSGKVPFDADSTIAVVFKHITEPVPDLDEPYKQYQPLVNTLLAKEPAARYQSGREVIADIEALERGETPANATLIFNQTTLNTAVNLNTDQATQTGKPKTQTSGKASTGKRILFTGIAIASILIILAGIILLQPQPGSNKIDDTAANQRELSLAYEKQELEKRQRTLENKLAENTLLEQQQLAEEKKKWEKQQKEKQQQDKLKREQANRSAQKKQAKAEAEARSAKLELQALKQKQQDDQAKRASNTKTTPAKQQKPKTYSTAYLNDLFKAADNALKSKRYTSATANYKKILQLEPDNVRAQKGLQQAKQQTPAEVSSSSNNEYLRDLLKAADNALSTGNFVSAKQNYEKVLRIEPDNQRAQQGLKDTREKISSKAADSNEAYTNELLKAADNALQNNRLSSAGYNYQKVLKRSPENKHATDGLNEVFNRYLKLALEEAKDNDFDDAAEYFLAAKKLKPGDKKLKSVGREIEQLQN